MKRIDNLASCIHLACCPYLIVLKISDYLGSPNEISFAIDISTHLARSDKILDMGNRAMQDLRYFPGCIEPIFKLNHWMPRKRFILILVSNRNLLVSPLTRSDDQPLVILTQTAIWVWFNPRSIHREMNLSLSSWSDISFIRIYNISKSLICQVFFELFLKYFLARKLLYKMILFI